MSDLRKPPFHLTNTPTRRKEEFVPSAPPHVGLYVCGPTVYSDVHLGNAQFHLRRALPLAEAPGLQGPLRPGNITDVGHLVGDVDEGEDKIAKRPGWSSSSRWRWCRSTPTDSMR